MPWRNSPLWSRRESISLADCGAWPISPSYGASSNLSRTPARSLDFWFEEFLRTRGAHIGLGDKGCPGIDIGRHRLAFRGGERGLDAVITHAERVLHDESGDHVVLQEFDELFVRANADDIDLVVRFLFGHGLAHSLRHDRIGNKHAAQVRCVGDEVLHY